MTEGNPFYFFLMSLSVRFSVTVAAADITILPPMMGRNILPVFGRIPAAGADSWTAYWMLGADCRRHTRI